MGRDDGFLIADVDVGLLDDDKVRRLVRAHGADVAARGLVAYLSTVLESWRRGQRLSTEDTAPLWLSCTDALPPLQQVGLLDSDNRIPEETWNDWFGVAFQRREERREAGRRGGMAAAKGGGRPPLNHRSTSAAPGPTYPTYPSHTRGRASRSGGPAEADEPTADILEKYGWTKES